MTTRSGQPHFSIAEAADECGVHPDTIRRKIRDGTIAGAVREGGSPNAPWLIPLSGLIAAGMAAARVETAPTPADHPVSVRSGSGDLQVELIEALGEKKAADERVAGLQRQVHHLEAHIADLQSHIALLAEQLRRTPDNPVRALDPRRTA